MTDPLLTEARLSQERACLDAGVSIRALESMEDFRAGQEVERAVWRLDDRRDVPITATFMRALEHGGGYVHGVYTASDPQEMIGIAVAFFGEPERATLHSHIAGVLPSRVLHGVGRALKLHQRWWALERGVHEMTWTFDPLVSRNAYFNLSKLGAQIMEYHEDFYGEMVDDINRGDLSDRLLALWPLGDPRVISLATSARSSLSLPAQSEAIVAIAEGDEPDVRWPVVSPETTTVTIAVPEDIERMRIERTELALRWRKAVRSALGGAVAEGWNVADFNRSAGYILNRTPRG